MSGPNLDAERALVGACLLDPEAAIRQAVEHVTEADFRDPRLAALFELVCNMWAGGDAIDRITVDARARTAGIKGVDGVYLSELDEATPTASNADYYARQVAEAATRRRLAQTGMRLQQLAEVDDDLGIVMGHARSEWEAVAGQTSGRLTARTLAEVLAEPDEYDWLIPNLLERMDRLILTGAEGAGKTVLIRQIAVLAAAGVHPTTFRTIDPIRVLVVDAENRGRQWSRSVRPMVAKARIAGQVDPSQTLNIVTVDDMPRGRLDMTNERDVGTLHRLVDQHEPDMLVLGPLYKLMPRAIQTDDDAAPLINVLDGLRGRGLALVMEAHAGKGTSGNGERDLAPRGSAALMGWPEFGLGLRVDRDALSVLPDGAKPYLFQLVRWRGDRDERAWPDRLCRGGEYPWTDERIETSRWTPRVVEA